MQLKELGEWKVGQKVIVKAGDHWGRDRVALIDKITDGLGGTIFVKGDRYKENGRQRGSGWSKNEIIHVTDKEIEKIVVARAKRFLGSFDWNTLTSDQVLEIYKKAKKYIELKRIDDKGNII